MRKSFITKLIFALSCLLISAITPSYFLSKTKSNLQIKWANGNTTQNLYFNPSNDQGVNETTLQTLATNAAAEWDLINGVRIIKGTSAGSVQEGVNEMYFSSDPNIFNSSNVGVAGVTLVSYKDTDGLIIEADILINEGFSIITNINNPNYIANIFTHEMGHFLGLDHSQSIGSTMFYALSLGQNKVANDDQAGLMAIYGAANANYKSISGNVVGSKNLYGVYGAQVEAISQSTGKIMGAAITANNGAFTIAGLPTNDSYFLYTKPAVKSKLSSSYSNMKSNFCDNGSSYRGSFFQACGGGNEGYPQAIKLNSSDVNVGNITIRCSVDVPPEYFQAKGSATNFSLPMGAGASDVGNAFVGFFSTQEMNSLTAEDKFNIDLRNLSSTYLSSFSANLYLEVQVLNQSFYTPFKANVSYVKNSVTTTMPSKYVLNSDGWVDINTIVRIPIDKVTTTNNLFEIHIAPEAITSSSTPSGIPVGLAYILPDYSNFMDNLNFYLVNVHLVQENSGSYVPVKRKDYVISDNTSCTDASNTYQLTNYSASSSSSGSSDRKNAIACGTIDTNGNSSGGPFGMIVGFSLSFFFFMFIRRLHFR